jgi:processive 1,2-diacylglycerol beta-glucosyltransferase
MTRVLILTASYGSGHNAAARSLAAAFERERTAVTVVDHFRELVHPLFDRASRTLYHGLLRRAPFLWGLGYSLGDWMASDSFLTLGVTRLGTKRLAALLDRLAPDVVVTVHATPAAAMSTLARLGNRVPPHTTVVTDFVAHSQWIAPHVDRYCVAADEVRHEYSARGIPEERIVVTGVPVRPEFAEPVSPAAARAALGLSPEMPVVLAMAGSQGGVGRLPDVAHVLRAMRRPLQGIVLAGHDAGLRTALAHLTDGTTIRTLGYVEDVRRLMAAADLLVTKAGGMTLAEAMAAETPLLLYGSLPGQERRNERFAARAGIALVARMRSELRPLLEHALSERDLLEHLRTRMRRLRRPDATRRIVGAVLERAVPAR